MGVLEEQDAVVLGMDIHALAHAGSRLHRAAGSLASVLETMADRNGPISDEDEGADTEFGQAHRLVAQARDHVLVTYALGQLRIGAPEDRQARIHDAYSALADIADCIAGACETLAPGMEAGARLSEACRDMSAAVMRLAPVLGPEITTGVGQTPVRLATDLQLVAETAGATAGLLSAP
ncbi:hypothetical protein ABZ442_30450 [Streptomyces triculaminicus]|uniref:hypothetical protein n=1 Tax=Streptomyces triculaminicus TaxID=2816232 RepID=UPI00340A6EB9